MNGLLHKSQHFIQKLSRYPLVFQVSEKITFLQCPVYIFGATTPVIYAGPAKFKRTFLHKFQRITAGHTGETVFIFNILANGLIAANGSWLMV